MKVLHVIHGFPPYYMAGSEVYSYNLVNQLKKSCENFIFSRVENQFEPSYSETTENTDGVVIRRVNKPQRDYTLRDKYIDTIVDDAFRRFAREIKPDIIHIGHLSHLSTNIVTIAKDELGIPVIYTIHDFWLYCYRGQAIKDDMDICPKPDFSRCKNCASRTFKEGATEDIFQKYTLHMKGVRDKIDLFLAPSETLKDYFVENGTNENKIVLSKYGFNKHLIERKEKQYDQNSKVVFGYMGRIIPVKGIGVLLEAFRELQNNRAELYIYGNPGNLSTYLTEFIAENVHIKGPYNNTEINQVLDEMDILIVPSLWYENSPLVIQEAFLAGIPVLTSNIGGMAELVHDGVNGKTFEVGSIINLKETMQSFIDDPSMIGKLKPDASTVRDIEDDAKSVLEYYRKVLG